MADIGFHFIPADPEPAKVQGTLAQAIRRAESRQKRRALLLVAPLLTFVFLTFIVPIGQMLVQSFYNPAFASLAPRTSTWMSEHPVAKVPDENAFSALVEDLREMQKLRLAGQAGTRVNYDYPGARSMFTAAARRAEAFAPPFRDALVNLDPHWEDPALWQALRTASHSYSAKFYLKALDLGRDPNGAIVQLPDDQRVHRMLFLRTIVMSLAITMICLFIAFPMARLMATLPMSKSSLLMILVLLPFWTSLLVRTTSWVVLLQTNGVINGLLVSLGVISSENRLELIYNKTGTIIAMTHVLLPFMILPLYSVMRSIPPNYLRAAKSLGASNWTAFRRVYLPQTLPGIAAGSLLVFILAVGYYVTPALVGGASGQLISNAIAFHMQNSLNWSLAAALAGLLLLGILILYWIYDRLVGINNMKFG